jgi:hypothetical protein
MNSLQVGAYLLLTTSEGAKASRIAGKFSVYGVLVQMPGFELLAAGVFLFTTVTSMLLPPLQQLLLVRTVVLQRFK